MAEGRGYSTMAECISSPTKRKEEKNAMYHSNQENL
jgi:hypothetical protein